MKRDAPAGRAVGRRAAGRGPLSGRLLLLVTLALGTLAYRSLLSWDPATGRLPPVEEWLFLPSGTSPQLVFALAAAALVRRRERVREALGGAGSLGWAALPLASGALLFVWGTHVEATDLLVGSLVLVTLGGALLLAGPRMARALSLPLVILLFAIPLPAPFTNQIVFPLQLASAGHAARTLSGFGVPVLREGDVLYSATATVEIVETCAGLRSMQMLTLLALVYVAFFEPGWRRGVLLVLAAPWVAYGVNVARVMLLVLEPSLQASTSHVVEGVLLFAVGAAILIAIDGLLARFVPGLAPKGAPAESPGRQPAPLVHWAAGCWLAALLALLAAISVGMPRWNPSKPGKTGALELPRRVDGWRRARKIPLDWVFLGAVGYSDHAQHRYEGNEGIVDLFVGRDDRSHRNRSLWSLKNALPGRGWEIEERGVLAMGPDGADVETVIARSLTQRVLTYHWYEATGGLLSELARAALATDRSPWRRSRRASVVRLTTPIEPGPRGREEAEARLASFLGGLGQSRQLERTVSSKGPRQSRVLDASDSPPRPR